jgi:hypothetical protein
MNNYHLPEFCCANCINSYMNSYGDAQCRKMPPGNVIHGGGVCDLWFRDDTAVVPTQPRKVEVVVVEDCNNCIYVSNGKCLRTGKDATSKCSKYETGYEFESTGTCETCQHSYYDGTTPRCSIDDHELLNIYVGCENFKEPEE